MSRMKFDKQKYIGSLRPEDDIRVRMPDGKVVEVKYGLLEGIIDDVVKEKLKKCGEMTLKVGEKETEIVRILREAGFILRNYHNGHYEIFTEAEHKNLCDEEAD